MKLVFDRYYKACLLLLAIFSTTNINAQKTTQAKLDSYFKGLPFKMNPFKENVFPQKYFSIVKYGAINDGITKNTSAIQKAIDECSKSGGGYVVVPSGIWLTGPIKLKDNINLHLEMGALLQFSKDYEDYDITDGYWEGTKQPRCVSPISARKVKNIAITGDGTIDGSGEVWRPVKKSKLTEIQWRDLIKSGGVIAKDGNTWWPTVDAMNGAGYLASIFKNRKSMTKDDLLKLRVYARPVMVSIIECKNVLLDGPTFQNSPAWNLHPLMCENLIVRNVNVRNPWYSQNGDGIDVESCKNVVMYNCKFDVGDDAMCMKSGKDKEGRDRGKPTENVVIADCIVYHGHGGFTIGSEMSGGMKNIKVSNCVFIGTDIGLRFKTQRGRGGVVEKIYIDNIFMKEIPTDALSFNMYYNNSGPTEDQSAEEKAANTKLVEVNEGTPIFREIYMKNIYCNGAKDAIVLQGLPEMAIKNIFIDNVTMKAERGISIYDADGIKITNAKISSSDPLIKISKSQNVVLDKVEPLSENKLYMRLSGESTKNITIKNVDAGKIKDKIEFGKDVPQSAVFF
jgi:polygalacturonase